MYEPPINIYTCMPDIVKEINEQTEEVVYKAVMNVGIDVDKDELIKALKYDRDQYYMGYYDGYRDKLKSIVYCKECKHCDPENRHCDHPMSTTMQVPREPDDFCSYGERKDDT